MSDWEFLLQKEGDQTWLPLESAGVEILEGRYRIVASTHIPNTEVQIRIVHYSTEETPPIKRVQKRSSLTHSQGLIAIIPFTSLKPGKWEFHCEAKSTTTSSAKPQQYIVHLEVLPIEYEVSDYTPQLDSETPAQYEFPDLEYQQNTELITDENVLNFPSQLDTDLGEIRIEENREKNLVDSTQYEVKKQFENIRQEQFVKTENIIQLPKIDDTKEANILREEATEENRENELIENQKIQLPNIPENQSIVTEKVNQEETKTEAILLTQRSANANSEPSSISATNSTLQQPTLQLILDQAAYIAQPGEALILSGEVTIDIKSQSQSQSQPNKPMGGFEKIYPTSSKKTDDIATNNQPIINANLQICLRNPQTSEILVESEQILPDQVPPIIFACSIHLPEDIKSRLILGQIILRNETETLASKSFTITAPLQEWLEVIDDNFVEEQHQTTTPESTKSDRKPPSFQDLVAEINQKSDGEQPLPPQIYKPLNKAVTGNKWDADALELPTFGNPLPDNLAKDRPKINELLVKSESATESDKNQLDDVWEDAASTPEQTKLQAETTESDESELETTENEETLDIKQNVVPFPTNFAPKNKAFKALKLEDRFFSRLNSLSNDSELSQWMKASSAPPSEEIEASTKLEKASESTKEQTDAKGKEDNDPMDTITDDPEFTNENFSGEIDWEAQEFVVEDELHEQSFPNQEQKWSTGLANIPQPPEESIETQPYIFPEDQPLPVPDIEVMAKDVIAGREVKVRVQLPDSLPRIYVKIWVYDRQAQAIVAGPRWLTDFIPNGMGQLEVITDLDIAYGCLEIKFEAIAVEMQTHRESHKAVIERLVIPPPPPSLPFDNLS